MTSSPHQKPVLGTRIYEKDEVVNNEQSIHAVGLLDDRHGVLQQLVQVETLHRLIRRTNLSSFRIELMCSKAYHSVLFDHHSQVAVSDVGSSSYLVWRKHLSSGHGVHCIVSSSNARRPYSAGF